MLDQEEFRLDVDPSWQITCGGLRGHICFECGRPANHLHHVVPRSLGGKKTIPLCVACHGKAHESAMILKGAESGRKGRMAQQEAAGRGELIIRGKIPFGYMVDPKNRHRMVEHPEEMPVAREIVGFAINGMDVDGIHREMHVGKEIVRGVLNRAMERRGLRRLTLCSAEESERVRLLMDSIHEREMSRTRSAAMAAREDREIERRKRWRECSVCGRAITKGWRGSDRCTRCSINRIPGFCRRGMYQCARCARVFNADRQPMIGPALCSKCIEHQRTTRYGAQYVGQCRRRGDM